MPPVLCARPAHGGGFGYWNYYSHFMNDIDLQFRGEFTSNTVLSQSGLSVGGGVGIRSYSWACCGGPAFCRCAHRAWTAL